ncbi:MAG TPA: hypothetical protein PKC34_07680 [Pseudomonadales bacterium]|jgi:hypothetical protein|nr:hypothetical protein [Pseudomonadales bacterium]HMW15411.1 hypothetical protein [Pseudomonadales bacterium]HMW83517.1 hypothetical protein [Pseudomonadales bacterium]HMY97142.1 hypothetical protein [Pseudomonadales bacterium]HMZ71160.1 hypothetical protein [Pseudomonadales bacterium]
MAATFLEIVELADGEVVLQRSDGAGDPLIQLRFSDEAISYLNSSHVEIAKAMIQAGIQLISRAHSFSAHLDQGADDDLEPRTLH